MKNLKKVLAMVLAFACTFSMFAGAKVFEDVPAGSDYSEAVTMLSDLGIIQGKDDGLYHPEDTITRAEACALIARMMTGDPDVSQYVGAQSFSDVQSGSWKDSAIGYCYINGIVIGVGDNKFEPDRAITDAEFITMVVRAMGYETADMKQNYPYSYMSNAQAIGLLDGTNMVASTDALRGEDAQVIYNALFTDYARGAMLVNTTHGTSVESYPTLAESVWGLTRAAVGTWDEDADETATLEYCKAHTWVVIGVDPENEGNILAYPISDSDGDIYTEGKGTTYSFKYDGDVSAVAGYQVELWGEGNHGEPEWNNKEDKYVWSDDWTIKAIKTVKGQTAYDYNASMVDGDDNDGTIDLEDASLDLDAVAENAKNVENAYAVAQYVVEGYHDLGSKMDAEDVETALNVRDGAQYKLVDWDSDGDVDWVVVSEANYYKVEAVNSTRLTVSSMDTKDDVEDEQDSKNVTWKLDDTTDVDGVDYKFVTEEDLAEGDIIEVTYTVSSDDDAQLVTATITKVEADTAELDKVSTKDTLELTFDGEVKKIADNNDLGDVVVPANPATYGDFDDEELGTEFALWENRNGFIVYSDYANETVNYLMVLDTGDGSDKTGERKLATMDVLYADNSVAKDVEVVSDLDLTGYYAEDEASHDARTWDETEVVGNVYKYWMDEDGTITKMEPMFSASAKYDNNYTYDESADRLKDTDDGFVASLEEADVIFAVTNDYINKDSMKVDDSKVMAVKQSDIPEIDANADNTTDDAALVDDITGTWLENSYSGTINYVAEVNKNGEASAAILGVENFNKFNDASTQVALVTSVSYDKNGVVTVEAAYNGEVTELSSVEDVDFDDIVEAYDAQAGEDKAISSASGTVDNALFGGAKLSTYLKDNAAYAEITVDADGNLTAVTFMDNKYDEDATAYVSNAVIGHYYEVSRRIITDVKSGNVAYGITDAYYYNNKNLYSVGRLAVDDTDLADEVDYYTIDGRPTSEAGYTGTKLSVVDGFEDTPDITAESDSNLIDSYINDKFDDADTYYVADLATKIGGDIVAAYAFEDSLGEVDKSMSLLGDQTMKAGETETFTVTAPAGQTVTDVKNVTVSGSNTAGITVQDQNTDEIQVALTRDVAAGKYTVSYTYTIDGKDYNASFVLTVEAADALVVDTIVPMADATTEAEGASVVDNGAVYFKLMDGKEPVSGVTNITFKDAYGYNVSGATVETGDNGAYKVTGLSAGNTYQILVDGQKIGELEVVAAASATIGAVTVDALGGVVSADVTLKGVADENVATTLTANTDSDGVVTNAVYKDGKVELTVAAGMAGKTATYELKDNKGVVLGSVTVAPTQLTLTATKGETTNTTLKITLSVGDKQLNKTELTAIGVGTTTGNYTLTGDANTVNNVDIAEDGVITITVDTGLSDSQSNTKLVITGTDNFAEVEMDDLGWEYQA